MTSLKFGFSRAEVGHQILSLFSQKFFFNNGHFQVCSCVCKSVCM